MSSIEPEQRVSRALNLYVGLCAAALLVGCGGGSSGGPGGTPAPPSSPTPRPTPTPTPNPTPTPSLPTPTPPQPPPQQGAIPSQFNTAEFRNSDGPDFHNAEYAWDRGFTGKGVTLAVIDDGLDVDGAEFAGRVHGDTQDVLLDRSPEGAGYHGTHVALVAAGGRNNAGIMGIAYDATVLGLRGDLPGDCNFGNPLLDTGCGVPTEALVAGIDQAVASRARVVNISISNTVAADPPVQDAVRRAVAAGVIIVLSAGNMGAGGSGVDGGNPLLFARSLADAGPGGVIIVGAVGANGVMTSFSNRAGDYRNAYIAALGEGICCVFHNGQLYKDANGNSVNISGTSFAAPQVTGAVALLAQAFPHLSGKEIVSLLLETAFDVGELGNDRVYGAGILDIARAFKPVGTTKLPQASSAISSSDAFAAGSPAMGDALLGQSVRSIALDKYRRAYQVELSAAQRSEPVQRLYGALGSQSRAVTLGNPGTAIAFSIDASDSTRQPWVAQLRLTSDQATSARVLAGRVVQRLSPELEAGFAFAESAQGLVAQVQGRDRPAFLIAQGATGDRGLLGSTDLALVVRRQFGGWGYTVSAESGEVFATAQLTPIEELADRRSSDTVRSFGLALDRRWADVDASFGLTWMSEAETILGARVHDGLGGGGAQTLFLDVDLGWSIAPKWRVSGAMRNGFTRADPGLTITGGSRMWSRSWSFDFERAGVFGPADRLGLRIAQPLRVEHGGLELSLPNGFDYLTLTPDYSLRRLSLAPRGREVMGEVAWRGPLAGGYGSLSAYYRRQPDHYAGSPNDKGIALRWSTDF